MATFSPRLLLCLWLVSGAAGAQTFTISILDSPGGSLGWAKSINAQGQIVGIGNTAHDFSRHAIQWNDGIPADLGAGDAEEAEALAINTAGQVVGWRRFGLIFRASLWSGGSPVTLPELGGGRNNPNTIATDINTAGQIVGSSTPLDGAGDHAVLWTGSDLIDLGTLGGTESQATAINDVGQIAGISSLNDGERLPQHATLWSNGAIIDLGTLGGSSSGALDINDASQVVGWSDVAGDSGRHATLWHAGVVTDLGTLGGSESAAHAINSNGQIVGWSLTPEGPARHATLWEFGVPVDLNTFLSAQQLADGWHLDEASDLTNCGCIVGRARNYITGEARGFLAYPTPDTPATSATIEAAPTSTTNAVQPAAAAQGGGGSSGPVEMATLALLCLLSAVHIASRRRRQDGGK